MPNRILWESICSSDTIASLAPEEEIFFYRLIVNCDDYGRCDARPSVLRSRCFQLQLDRVGDDLVAGWLQRLADVGLVRLYQHGERPYLQMVTWGSYQRIRAKRSRYPAPDFDNTCRQTLADDDTCSRAQRNPEAESESGGENPDSNPEAGSARAAAGRGDEEAPPREEPRAIRPVPKPEPRVDPFALCLATIAKLSPGLPVGGDPDKNRLTVNTANAPPELIAEAYVASMNGDWPDDFVRKRGSLHAVVDNLGGYVTSRKGAANGKARGTSQRRHL